MAFDFSLANDLITPIRPHRVEQLFSPNTRTSNRFANDVTYRITDHSVDYARGKIITAVTDAASQYPIQSTGIKVGKHQRPNSVLEAQHLGDTVTSNHSLDTTYSKNDLIPQYKPVGRLKEPSPIRAVSFHPSGDVFAIGSNARTLQICVYPSDEAIKKILEGGEPPSPLEVSFKCLQIHRGSVYCCGFNETGDLLATGSNDQTVHLIKYDSRKRMPTGNEYKFSMHSGTVRDLCFMRGSSGSDTLLTAGAGDNKIYATDCTTLTQVQSFQGHKGAVMSIHCWDDSDSFVSGGADGASRLWDLRSKRCCAVVDPNPPEEVSRAPVGVVRIEPTGKLLASGYKDGKCMLYDVRGGRVVQLFRAHDDEIRTLNYSPKSYYLLTASYDCKVKLVDLQGDLTRRLPSVDIAQLSDKVVQTAWHPIDYNFVTTSADGHATLWTIPEWTENGEISV